MLEAIKTETGSKMDKSIESMINDFKTIRTGRATLSVLDHIFIDCYGQKMPINQLANLSIPEPRTIAIEPWDKSTFQDIEKGILKSDLGLSPVNDGKIIRLTFPQLTEERRKELVKQVKQRAETGKVSIRNIRREANEKIKKAEKEDNVSKDDVKNLQDEIQKITDNYITKIGTLTDKKEKEIMEI